MKIKHLITAVPLFAIALVIAHNSSTKSFPPDTDPLESVGSDRSRFVSVPESRQLPQSEEWEVTKIADGDTITVRRGSRKEKIRFCGVDSDEVAHSGKPAQSVYANQAKEYLQQLINQSGNKVAVTMIEQDRYGRWVGEVWVNPGTDKEELANGLLVLKGLARVYGKYVGNCFNRTALERAEETAIANRAGVWADENAIPPWEWRKRNR